MHAHGGPRARKRAKTRGGEEEEEEAPDQQVKLIKRMDNRIYFYSEVTKHTVLALHEYLHAAAQWALQSCALPTKARVYLYINSGGGDVYAGFSAMDHIRGCRVPVVTIADGYVASAATFMLLGGTRRYGMPSTNILIHQLSAEFWGKFSELEFELVNTRKLMDTIRRLYERHTKLTGADLDRMLSGELMLTCEESMQHGFITRIL